MKYIDTTDMPSDPNGAMSQLRRELRKVFNQSRRHPETMQLLKTNLEFVLSRIKPEEVTDDEDNTGMDSTLNSNLRLDTECDMVPVEPVNLTRTVYRGTLSQSSEIGEPS